MQLLRFYCFFIFFFPIVSSPLLHAQTEDIVGKGTISLIFGTPHQDWYEAQYVNTQLDIATIQKFPQHLEDNFKILIVAGSWCEDTRKQLPHLIKILDYWHVKPEYEIIFVNKEKKSKEKGYKKLKIELVPTFIFFNSKEKEVGRIIESPKENLEKDMLNILQKY